MGDKQQNSQASERRWTEAKNATATFAFDLLSALTLDLPFGVLAADEKGTVCVLNLAAGVLFRANRSFAIGRPVAEIYPENRLAQVMSSEGGASTRTVRIQNRQTKVVSLPLIFRGELFGAVEVYQDVEDMTELREQLGCLTEKHHLLEEIVDASFEEFITVDGDGHIVCISGPTAAKMGLDKKSAQGVDLFSLPREKVAEFCKSGQGQIRSLLTMDKAKALELLPSLSSEYRVIGICNASLYACDCLEGQGAKAPQPVPTKLPPKRALGDLRNVTGTKYSFDDIVGHHPAIAEAKRIAALAARGDSTILIKGESGTGKEMFSHAIHNASRRRSGAFIKVNCAGIPEALLESELFGYSEGAFTGARKGGKPGKFELAHGGTIFLDEIGDLSMPMQSKLLRTLQEGEVERVGSTNVHEVDVRVIATTKFDLIEKINKGEFREDLYYRLEVIAFRIPPLRERLDDIRELTQFLLDKLSKKLVVQIKEVEEAVIQSFSQHDWPGNIRELENVLEGACNFVQAETLTLECLPDRFHDLGPKKLPLPGRTDRSPIARDIAEEQILEALKRTNGNKRRAAKELSISRATLYNKIRGFHLDV